MIYNNNKINNAETNIENSTALKIAMNAKTFRMLSDTLYSDKIKAIIRELSCNAYDSQVVAGTIDTKKTFIHLPTLLNPIFKIRDYGTGMSHEQLLANFLTYGESTKDNSNEQIGCFGIGSKSPFAYTDSFVVISYYDGIENSYNVYLDNGIPNCVLVNSTNTNEENGLLIQFNVEQDDVRKFKEAAEKIFIYFDVLPEFNIELNILKEKFDIEKETYSLNLGGYSTPKVEAVQGNISYPVDLNLLNKLNFFSKKIVLKCNIGDFGFAPSREAISYDSETIDFLNKKLLEIEKDIVEHILYDLKSSTNLGEYTKKIINYSRSITFSDNFVKQYNLETFLNVKIDYRSYKHINIDQSFFNFKKICESRDNMSLVVKRNNRYDKLISLYLHEKYVLIYNDLGKKGSHRLIIDYYEKNKNIGKRFLLIDCEKDDLNKIEFYYGKIKPLSEFVEYNENKIKEERKQKLLNKKLFENDINSIQEEIFVIKQQNSSYYIMSSLDNLDLDTEYYYVPIKSKTNSKTIIKIFGEELEATEHKTITLLSKDINVIFIKEKRIKKYLNNYKLKSFDDYLRDNFKNKFSFYFKYINCFNKLNLLNNGFEKFLCLNINDFKNKSNAIIDIYKIIKLRNRFFNFNKTNIYNYLFLNRSYTLKTIVKALELEHLIENNDTIEVFEKFPLLKYVDEKNYVDQEFKNYVLNKKLNKR